VGGFKSVWCQAGCQAQKRDPRDRVLRSGTSYIFLINTGSNKVLQTIRAFFIDPFTRIKELE